LVLILRKNYIFNSRYATTTYLLIPKPNMSNRKLTDLNDLINLSQKNIEHMEKSENISLHKRFTSNLPKVRVNVDDISFVIGNLLTNALDSMPKSGKLLIE